ncbi:DUF645 family protein, partial [Vibrio cholerae]
LTSQLLMLDVCLFDAFA